MLTSAVANQKGSVGKTTLTRELAACYALRGYQTLAVDCDPQGNLTNSWIDAEVYEATLSHVLIEPESPAGFKAEPLPLDDAIVESPVENLDIVPADISLARFEMQPDYLTHRLCNQIREHGRYYDLVLIDCPGSGSCFTAALYSADYVIVSCTSDAMGLQGL